MKKNSTQNLFKNSTIYIPYMCDHARMVSAALRACGVDAETLPESDKESITLGRRHTSGKECLPMAITLGDFLKKLYNNNSNGRQTIFLMPTTNGPCRFGQYTALQKKIIKELGFSNFNILSPNTADSYTNLTDNIKLPLFKRLSWKGVVSVDMLQKVVWAYRPYELIKGQTDSVYSNCLVKLEKCIENNGKNIKNTIKGIIQDFKKISIDRSYKRPVIGIVGEIFTRGNSFSNQNIVRKIEESGAEAYVVPMYEWFQYISYLDKYRSLQDKNLYKYLKAIIAEYYQDIAGGRIEHLFQLILYDNNEPHISRLLMEGKRYINSSYEGEAILSIGKAVDMIKTKKVSAIINIMPFSCMPGLIVTAISKKLKQDFNSFPWLDIDYDGTEGGNIETMLQAFIYRINESFQ